MDLTLDDDQRLLHDTFTAFARDARDPDRTRALEEADSSYDTGLWQRMAELGFAGAPLPERHGGSGSGLLELGFIVENLAANALSTPIFSGIVEAGLLLADCASDEQQAAWLPDLAVGRRCITAAYLETHWRFDPTLVETRLSDDDGTYVLVGQKRYARDAASADAVVCLARLDGGELALAIVEAGQEGLHIDRMPASGGESLWSIRFNGVRVPPNAVIRGNGIAGAIDRMALRGAALKACELVGIGQAALDLTVDYATSRKQFGVPIGSFQAVHHHCAEMLRDISVSRLLARQACAMLDQRPDARREVSFAKAKASDAVPHVTRIAHQIHGAVAFYRDYPLELYYHRAIAAQSAYGDALHHRRLLGDMLVDDLDCFRGKDRHDI